MLRDIAMCILSAIAGLTIFWLIPAVLFMEWEDRNDSD